MSRHLQNEGCTSILSLRTITALHSRPHRLTSTFIVSNTYIFPQHSSVKRPGILRLPSDTHLIHFTSSVICCGATVSDPDRYAFRDRFACTMLLIRVRRLFVHQWCRMETCRGYLGAGDRERWDGSVRRGVGTIRSLMWMLLGGG